MAYTPLVLVDGGLVAFATNHGIWALPLQVQTIWVRGVVDFSGMEWNAKWRGIAAAVADAFDVSPERLIAAIAIGFEYWKHPLLVDACCGPGAKSNPLDGAGDITFEEFRARLAANDAAQKQAEANKLAKRAAMATRRAEFAASRDFLVLALLDSGIPYRCAHPGCVVADHLTLDHKLPLSRGGTDDLTNLQFMCVPHNSAKGDRT